MVTWVIFLTIGLVIGIAAGMFIGQLDDIKRKQREELQNKLENAKQELADYKHDVKEHFVKTSTLVNNMTQSYKAIHDHLSSGAGTLCDSPLEVGKLNISDVNMIEKQEPAEPRVAHAENTKDQLDIESENKDIMQSVNSEKTEKLQDSQDSDLNNSSVGAVESESELHDKANKITASPHQETTKEQTDPSRYTGADTDLEAKEEGVEDLHTKSTKPETDTNIDVGVNRTVH